MQFTLQSVPIDSKIDSVKAETEKAGIASGR